MPELWDAKEFPGWGERPCLKNYGAVQTAFVHWPAMILDIPVVAQMFSANEPVEADCVLAALAAVAGAAGVQKRQVLRYV